MMVLINKDIKWSYSVIFPPFCYSCKLEYFLKFLFIFSLFLFINMYVWNYSNKYLARQKSLNVIYCCVHMNSCVTILKPHEMHGIWNSSPTPWVTLLTFPSLFLTCYFWFIEPSTMSWMERVDICDNRREGCSSNLSSTYTWHSLVFLLYYYLNLKFSLNGSINRYFIKNYNILRIQMCSQNPH